MKIRYVKLITTTLFLMLFSAVNAQVGITSYSIFALGVNTDQNKRISGEVKLLGNRNLDIIQLEPTVFYNFKPRAYHRFSLGVGVNFAPFLEFDRVQWFVFPVQLEVYPLQNFKQLSLMFEFSPEIGVEDGVAVRNLWGIRYSFGKNKENQ